MYIAQVAFAAATAHIVDKVSMLFVDTIVTQLSCRSNASYTFLNTGSDTSTFCLSPYLFHFESPDINPNSFPSLD